MILRRGQTVVVIDHSGRETKGRVDLVDGSSLTLVTFDTDTFTESEVSQIRRTDSVWNGMQG